jgi:hypothetical protein
MALPSIDALLDLAATDERTVLTYTLGHVAQGAEAVNSVLGLALNVDRAMLLKSALRGYPMSCPKIRAKIPDTCARVGCDCTFDASASYPHPLLHLDALRARARRQGPVEDLSLAQQERLALDWHKVAGDLERLAGVARELEASLIALLQRKGSVEVASLGTMVLEGGKPTLKDRTPQGKP